jgi:hypothetical protein
MVGHLHGALLVPEEKAALRRSAVLIDDLDDPVTVPIDADHGKTV